MNISEAKEANRRLRESIALRQTLLREMQDQWIKNKQPWGKITDGQASALHKLESSIRAERQILAEWASKLLKQEV